MQEIFIVKSTCTLLYKNNSKRNTNIKLPAAIKHRKLQDLKLKPAVRGTNNSTRRRELVNILINH